MREKPPCLFQLKAKDILDKYDEEIHGEKKEFFVLGEWSLFSTVFVKTKLTSKKISRGTQSVLEDSLVFM